MPMLMPSASSASTGHLRALKGTQKIPGSRSSGGGDRQRHQWDLKRDSASDTSFEADERTGTRCWEGRGSVSPEAESVKDCTGQGGFDHSGELPFLPARCRSVTDCRTAGCK